MRELEIYIHIPFCVRKCAYCDFLSFSASEELQMRYFDALETEIEQFICANQQNTDNYEVVSVFFGGGTPSYPDAAQILRILKKIRENFKVRKDAEITIECNPGTLTDEKLTAYHKAGINRLSIGLQSADNSLLRELGRIHTWEKFKEEYDAARHIGFRNINVDLMYGLPKQTPAIFRETLQKVLSLAPPPEHISAYSLIIEEGTIFRDRYADDAELKRIGEKPLFLPDEDAEDEMQRDLLRMLKEAGLRRYEISNYAKPGFASVHNCGYWERREYAGFGLGASGMLRHPSQLEASSQPDVFSPSDASSLSEASDMKEASNLPDAAETPDISYRRETPDQSEIARPNDSICQSAALRYKNHTDLNRYLSCDFSKEESFTLTKEQEIEETMFLGLRKMCGVDLALFEKKYSLRAETIYPETIKNLRQAGLLEIADHHLRLTERGIDVSNVVMAEFLLE